MLILKTIFFNVLLLQANCVCTREDKDGMSRALPRVLLLGAQKCGTTSMKADMHRVMPSLLHATVPKSRHGIDPGYFEKELHFFDNSDRFNSGAFLYGAYFPECKDLDGRVPIDATPNYFSSEGNEGSDTWDRAHSFYDSLSSSDGSSVEASLVFIVIVRDPVDRYVSAFSHYHHSDRRHWNNTINTYVDKGVAACSSRQVQWECQNDILKKGVYSIALDGWVSRFKKAQFLITTFSYYHNRTHANKVMQEIAQMIGLESKPLKTYMHLNHKPDALEKTDVDLLKAKETLRKYYEPHNVRFWNSINRYTSDKDLRVKFIGEQGTF
eukprot:m.94701 g.94701  ORF g.94701 m.94701 type:complete len:325 (-) comp26749_c0_seq1:50-1024(-)